MIIFSHTPDDVLGTLMLDGERYQMRKSDSAEPDVYHWHGTSTGRKGWVKLNGFKNTARIAAARTEWYRAGGTNEKAKQL